MTQALIAEPSYREPIHTFAATPKGTQVSTDDRFFDKRDGTVLEIEAVSERHGLILGYRYPDRNSRKSTADIIMLADIDEHYGSL